MARFGKIRAQRKEKRPRKAQKNKEPHAADLRAGNRLRELRLLRGLTQMALAERVGVTFQQIQKYENGSNRLSASRIAQIARALDVRPAYFFEEKGEDNAAEAILDRRMKKWIGLFEALPDRRAKDRMLIMVRQAVHLANLNNSGQDRQ